jgi:malate permease and related proteins
VAACRTLRPVILDVLLSVVVPVFAVIAVGAFLARRLRLEVAPITRLAIYAAVPALVFRTLSTMTLDTDAIVLLLAGYGLQFAALATAAWAIGLRWAPPARRALVASTLFPNAANMMLPISLFAFGEAGLERALVLYVATALLMFSLGPLLVGRATGASRALRTVVTFPVLWGAIAGVVAARAGIALPLGLDRAVGLLADAAVPLVLLSLGVQVGRMRAVRPQGANLVAVALKLVIAPVVAFIAGSLVGLQDLDLAVLTLLAAMPTAINLAMLAAEFGGDADQAGRSVVWGTLASLVTLPVVLALLAPLHR